MHEKSKSREYSGSGKKLSGSRMDLVLDENQP
jgi:hypothetical protein